MSEAPPRERCVVVTGGSRGLGLALVHYLLSRGFALATCRRSETGAIADLRAAGGDSRVFWAPCEIGRADDEAAFFAAAEGWAGERMIYGMINNAGVARDGVLATFPNVDSEQIIEINLLGALRMSRLALRHMLAHEIAGRIINISSIIGSRGYTGLAAYSASKAGMDGLTRALAREVGRRGITVNSIAPGYLETEMSSTLATNRRQQIINRTPIGRLGRVEDVCPLAHFLLSDDAAFLTGQTILVDGGITC